MSFHLANPDTEYSKNKKLKKEDVETLLNWANKQPHLPPISELQAILFLQSCYYKNELAKTSIETYFTFKTLNPDLFKNKNPTLPSIKKTLQNSLGTVLPKQTPEGYTIFFLKLMNPNPENFNFVDHMKYFDLMSMLELYQNGTSKGHVIVADLKGASFGHLTKAISAGPLVLKKFMFYVQEAIPLRLKGLHFVNIVPFMDKILALIKPLMKIELLNLLYLHNDVEDLTKFIPLEFLPEDYGGSLQSTATLHEISTTKYLQNIEFFNWEEQQVTEENKRVGKSKNLNDIFGVEGTFKKLEID